MSASGVACEQSEKSGNVSGRSAPRSTEGAPAPSGPWQALHAAWYSVAASRMSRGGVAA